MFQLLLLFSLVAISGLALESRLPFNDLPRRFMVVVTAAAAQLLLMVQALSCAAQLTGPRLLLANLLCTGLVLAFTLPLKPRPARLPWLQLLRHAGEAVRLLRCPVSWAMLVLACVTLTAHCVIGALVIPFSDNYHFEMPAFWMQHRTIAPFPASNPRLVAVSFVAEALSLPGYLYARTPLLFPVLTWLAALLTLMLIFALARRLGARPAAAAAAAALIAGYSVFLLDCRYSHASFYLAGMWFGASLLFLFSCRPGDELAANLGGALLCFFMACGAKNSSALLAPVFGALGVLVLGRSLWSWPALRSALAAVLFSLLASGLLWNYAQNQSWFGDPRGPEFLRQTMAADFQPRSVWTRCCRGLTLLAGDTIWIPRSWQSDYNVACRAAVRCLGGRATLPADRPSSNFEEEATTPRKGLGFAWLLFALPGLLLAAGRWARAGGDPEARRNAGCLLVATVGAFLVSHTLLGWQSLGLLRLTPAFVVAGAPLAALVLERKSARVLALVVLALSVAALSLYCLGSTARRLSPKSLPAWITRLQNRHQRPVQIEWRGRPLENLILEEDYTLREIYERMWHELPQPAVVGLVGDYDSEFYFLFGRRFVNRVVSLRDTRTPDALLEPPADLQLLVLADYSPDREAWARARRFEPVFRVYDGGRCVFVALEKPIP